MEVVKFGGTEEEQTYLADLVLKGEKVATSSLKELQKIKNLAASNIGDTWEIRDGQDENICLVEVVNVKLIEFGEVDESFAIAEGDGSYENWFSIHDAYYSMLLGKYNLKLSQDTKLECVYFKKI